MLLGPAATLVRRPAPTVVLEPAPPLGTKRKGRSRRKRPLILLDRSMRSGLLGTGLRRRLLPHTFGDDAHLLDPGALGGVDDEHDVTVAERAGAGDEHRLLLAVLEDRPQLRFEILPG